MSVVSPEGVGKTLSPDLASGRLRFVFENTGFLPNSAPELTHALALTKLSTHRSGTARYLNKILLSQLKTRQSHPTGSGIDPESGVRAVTHQFADYYGDAAEGFSQLMELTEKLHGLIEPVDERSESDVLANSLGSLYLKRFVAVRDYCYGDDPQAKNPLRRNSSNQYATASRLQEVIEEEGGNELLYDASGNQMARFIFWEAQLLTARSHQSAAIIAEEALREHGNALG